MTAMVGRAVVVVKGRCALRPAVLCWSALCIKICALVDFSVYENYKMRGMIIFGAAARTDEAARCFYIVLRAIARPTVTPQTQHSVRCRVNREN
jgi:hypothetical protein